MENKAVKTELKEGEWIVEGRFIYILHNPDGRYPRNKFHVQVCPDWFGEVPEAEAEKVAQVFGAAYDMLEALKAAVAYDDALQSCVDDPERMSSFCTATGEDLDALYNDWISKTRAAIKKAQPHE